MSEQPYTPTTDEVRRGWIVGETRDGYGVDHDDLESKVAAEFDRWLAATVRAAKAEAWAEAHADGCEYVIDRPCREYHPNPYLQESDQ